MGFVSDIVGGITGSGDQADAARQAADSQLQGIRESNDLLRQFNQQATDRQMPFLQGGYAGLNRLMYGLGLGGSANGAAAPNALSAEQMRAELLPQYTTAPQGGGPAQASAEEIQRRAARQEFYALDPKTGRYGFYQDHEAGGDNGGTNRKWSYVEGSGTGATPQRVDEAGLNAAIRARMDTQNREQQQWQSQQGAQGNAPGFGNLLQTYRPYEAMTPETFKTDPSYQWRLDQGNNALTRSMAAGGNLNSGRALKALTDYNQGAASQEYQAAYGRHLNDWTTGYNAFNQDQNTQYNRLMGLVGVGQGSANQIANQTLQTGGALANNAIQGANAQAAGQIAQGNETANGFNNLMGLAGVGLGAFGGLGGGLSGAASSMGARQGLSMYGGAASNGSGLSGWGR